MTKIFSYIFNYILAIIFFMLVCLGISSNIYYILTRNELSNNEILSLICLMTIAIFIIYIITHQRFVSRDTNKIKVGDISILPEDFSAKLYLGGKAPTIIFVYKINNKKHWGYFPTFHRNGKKIFNDLK